MRLALVEPDLREALQVTIGQPVEDEERALDPPDLAKGKGEAVLSRVGGELAQDVRGDDGAGGHGGGEPEDVRPVRADEPLVDATRDHRGELGAGGGRGEGVEPPVGEVADARREAEGGEGGGRGGGGGG